jgi:serine protease Do
VGVGLFQCVRANCLVAGRNSRDSVHVFNVEPSLWQMTGPARRVLREGDVLVAIDGHPITTRAGGARLATLGPSVRTALLVRRDGRELTVAMTTVASCRRPSIQITSSDGGPPADVARRALPRIATPERDTAETLARSIRVAGRLGVLATSLTIDSVAPNSAAARAGLRRGDVLVSIEDRPTPGAPPGGPPVLRIIVRRAGRLHELTAVQAPARRPPGARP